MARFVRRNRPRRHAGRAIARMSCGDAAAQQRSTCSQARAHCGTQRVCQRRFENCMETGCWTVLMVKRCGYEKR